MDRALVEKTYRYMEWLLHRTAKFPKEYRYSLASRINGLIFGFFETALKAYTARNRKPLLFSLSQGLDALRYYVRLSMDMKLISVSQYEHSTECLVEIGKLVGGWIRKETVGDRVAVGQGE